MRELVTLSPAPAFEGFSYEAEEETVELTVGELTLEELLSYNTIAFMFSGGKDSWACVLKLLDLGVPREMMELWHHEVDGREGGKLKMDWPCTADYCRKAAEALGIPIYFSWKQGGFEGEMLRENARTRPTSFETPSGEVKTVGGNRGKCSTRRRFPQAGKDLTTRWCSPYLKIDVCATALRNQDRFHGKRVLVVTGERAEEGGNRANYLVFEPHKADLRDGKKKRHIDHYRPVHKMAEKEVWALLEKHRVNPHPCYRLGFNRASCMPCIFGNDNQWATVAALSPETVETIGSYEDEFGVTIDRKKRNVRLRVLNGTPYPAMNPKDKAAAMSTEWTEPIFLAEGEWKLPAGAFKKDGCGPS